MRVKPIIIFFPFYKREGYNCGSLYAASVQINAFEYLHVFNAIFKGVSVKHLDLYFSILLIDVDFSSIDIYGCVLWNALLRHCGHVKVSVLLINRSNVYRPIYSNHDRLPSHVASINILLSPRDLNWMNVVRRYLPYKWLDWRSA